MVWGDYGRMDRKVFMGVAQVNLDDLDLSNIVFGWYKLFTTASIVGPTRRSSQSSLDSAYNGARWWNTTHLQSYSSTVLCEN